MLNAVGLWNFYLDAAQLREEAEKLVLMLTLFPNKSIRLFREFTAQAVPGFE